MNPPGRDDRPTAHGPSADSLTTNGPTAGGPSAHRPAAVVDARGRRCPIPIIELARRIGDVAVEEIIELLADDPAAAADVAAWCRMRGHDLVAATPAHPATGAGDSYLVRRRR